MINIIHPSQFKTIPWKNGKGQTTELAISENGNLQDFDWRLSIANVVENGSFSDFSGYERNLILLEGNGIELSHDFKINVLDKLLDISSFNGASKTNGKLIDGQIKDFNLMTRNDKYVVDVKTFNTDKEIQIENIELSFVYSHIDELTINNGSKLTKVPAKHLAIIENESLIHITGKFLIIIKLDLL